MTKKAVYVGIKPNYAKVQTSSAYRKRLLKKFNAVMKEFPPTMFYDIRGDYKRYLAEVAKH
jgi:hypothetical protein